MLVPRIFEDDRTRERRCSRSSSVVYAELGTILLNVPVLTDPELLVSGVAKDADFEEGNCFVHVLDPVPAVQS